MGFGRLGSRTVACAVALLACFCCAGAASQEMRHEHAAPAAGKAPVFVASTAKPFPALMNDAMAVMDYGMKRAPMDGVAGHDFVTMMIPHHQGAIDMAKGVLLYSNDPALRNLAQGIITEQQNEINVMLAWLQRYEAAKSRAAPEPLTREE
jgi:uncharacterized protein (DUF305 family)